jgi:hypothetical protein
MPPIITKGIVITDNCCDKTNFYNTFADFPTTGTQNRLYVDKTTFSVYIWDVITEAYITADDDAALALRPWVKVGDTTATSTTSISKTDDIYHDGRVIISNGTFSDDDCGILINRDVTGDNLFSHAIRDESSFESGPTTGAYASFDASPTINGDTRLNHVNGFQTRIIFNNSAGVDSLFGHTSLFVHNGGNVTTGYGYHASTLSGTGTYGNYYGFFMEPQTNPNAFFLYSGGNSPSYMGGLLQTGSNIISTGFIKSSNIWSNNDFNSVGVGFGAKTLDTAGFYQTLVGHNAGTNSTSLLTQHNTMVGASSGYTNAIGNNNTYVGSYSGYLSTGSGNVFIGNSAGYNELGSNKLYISNSNTATPLIGGDFSTGNLGIGTATPATKLDVNGNIKAVVPAYLSTAAAAADVALLTGSMFKVTNGDGTSQLHIKD